MEEPNVETPQEPEKETTVDFEGLVKELQAAQITDPEKLKGHLTNAKDYHRMQSERDRYSQDLQALRAELSEFKNVVKPRDEYHEDKPIDIEDVVARAIRKERERETMQQRKVQENISKTWNKISSNENFSLVKDDFEAALRDPVTNFKLQTGEIDAIELFHGMVTNKYKGLTKKALEALQSFKGAGTVQPPHIESNARVGNQKTDNRDDKQKKLDKLAEKGKKPGGLKDAELDDVLGLALGNLF